MAASTKYQRFALRMNSPWNYANELTKTWSLLFSMSGAVDCPAADQEATALDLWEPVASLATSATWLAGWDHYPIGSSTHDNSKSYVSNEHVANGSGTEQGNNRQQLEVAFLAFCPVGTSSKGRPTYLRKWIHDCMGTVSDPNEAAIASEGTGVIFDKWDHGCGPHNLVPVSPTTGVQGGPWGIEPHLFTHQLRRSPKRKIVITPGNVEDEISKIAKVLGGYAALYELVGALV
jgi:hypothetical protein